MTQANQADFFGEGVNDLPSAATGAVDAPSPDQIAENERKRRAWLAAQGLDENGAQLPAYGTPISRGGTATGYQVTSAPYTGPMTHTFAANPNDPNAVNAANAKNVARTAAGGSNASSVLGSFQGDFNGTGGEFIPTVGSANSLGSGGGDSSQVIGNSLANSVLNSRPVVSQDAQVDVANRDRLTPVVDPSLATSPETDRALAQSQDLIDRVLNAPSQTKILGDQALSNQLALAHSARGGAGAVQSALDQAQGMAPQLMQQSDQAAIQEQVARAGAAGQAASIYAGVATNDANRAANIATANQNAGLQVLNNLTSLTGQQLQFDAAKMQSVGQLARDYFANSQAFAQMDVQTQIAQWEDLTKRYGIDVNAKTAIEAVAASKKVGPLDALKMVLGIGQAAAGIAAL